MPIAQYTNSKDRNHPIAISNAKAIREIGRQFVLTEYRGGLEWGRHHPKVDPEWVSRRNYSEQARLRFTML